MNRNLYNFVYPIQEARCHDGQIAAVGRANHGVDSRSIRGVRAGSRWPPVSASQLRITTLAKLVAILCITVIQHQFVNMSRAVSKGHENSLTTAQWKRKMLK